MSVQIPNIQVAWDHPRKKMAGKQVLPEDEGCQKHRFLE
jgi:hypothetical protein